MSPKHLLGQDSFSKLLAGPRSLRDRLLHAWAHFVVNVRKEDNLPDARVNGNIFFWQEHAVYTTLFGPTVGVKVIDFLEDQPHHPHAQAILAEIHRMREQSWPTHGPVSDEPQAQAPSPTSPQLRCEYAATDVTSVELGQLDCFDKTFDTPAAARAAFVDDGDDVLVHRFVSDWQVVDAPENPAIPQRADE